MTDEDFIASTIEGSVDIVATGPRTWNVSVQGSGRDISSLLNGSDDDLHRYQGISWDFTEDGRGEIVEAVLNVRPATETTPGVVLSVVNRMAAAQNDDYPAGSLEGSIRLFTTDEADRDRALRHGTIAYEKLWTEPLMNEVTQRMDLIADCDEKVLEDLMPQVRMLVVAYDRMNRSIAAVIGT